MSVIFPKWFNALPTVMAVAGLGGLCSVVAGFWYWATPSFWEVGYMPTQPGGGFNHQIHAGKLGIDCRYCHSNVEVSPEANIPAAYTCMGCHAEGHLQLGLVADTKVQFIRDAYAANESIPWDRIHKLPDYVRNFPHNIHVKAGVSCYSCHGQITAMPVVFQHESISMSWCLDCHREITGAIDGHGDVSKRLVPQGRQTQLQWVEEEWLRNPGAHADEAAALLESIRSAPPDNCGACHY